jgi:hypothetical protein
MRARVVVSPAIVAAVLATASAGEAESRSEQVETCAGQSEANFPKAFTSNSNLVDGPLALIGAGRLTDADTVREFGGNKFPAVVAAGHTVTIRVPRALQDNASLSYGDGRPDGLKDGYPAIKFKACGPRRAQSDADGKAVVFWSGFILTDAPRCLRVRVRIDRQAEHTRRIPLGRRCS